VSIASSDQFDSASLTEALVGTWTFPSHDEPTGLGYLHFTADGRAFDFAYDPEQPTQRIQVRFWYTVESPSVLRFRPEVDSPGSISGYHLDGASLTLSNSTRTFLCLRPSPDEVPAWFRECLALAMAQA
jgi:hypothetical protein